MFNSLPIIIQDYIRQMSDTKTRIDIRFNSYNSLKNIQTELEKHLKEFEKNLTNFRSL